MVYLDIILVDMDNLRCIHQTGLNGWEKGLDVQLGDALHPLTTPSAHPELPHEFPPILIVIDKMG